MSTLDELKLYYPQKTLVGDGGALTEYVADSGSVSTIVDAALTQADDYWNGGLIVFLGDTPTVALRGIIAHIFDFDAASDTLTLAKNLPAVVATGEKFKLILGGGYRSDTEVLSLLGGGVFPELEPIALTNITGVTVKYISGGFISGNVSMEWTDATDTLDIGGTGYVVTGDINDIVLDDGAGAYVIIDIIEASLPVGDDSETIVTSRNQQTLTPDVEGYESSNSNKGKLRYRLMIAKNEAGDTMNTMAVTTEGDATTYALDSAETSDLSASSFDLVDATGLPSSGFFLYNETQDDFRYIDSVSGNTLTPSRTDAWTKMVVTANNTTEPFIGDRLTGPSAATGGIIQAIILSSGTWAGGTAVATIYLSDLPNGETYANTDQTQISAVNIGTVTGSETKGIRDKTGATWIDTDVILEARPVDIADGGSSSPWDSPASEVDYPDSAIVFDYHYKSATSLSFGNVTTTSMFGIWYREWIMDSAKANTELLSDTKFDWS